MKQEINLRKCRIQDHNEGQIVLRCTFYECIQHFRWMCAKCVKLHKDHVNYCLDIEEFENPLKGNNEMYLFKERKQLKFKILEEYARRKKLILSLFEIIEQQYMESFAKLELEENTIQALYQRIQTANTLTLSEDEITAYQIKQNVKEASLFREGQNQVCSDIMTFNSKIDQIILSLETLVGQKYETVTENLEPKYSHSILTTGNFKNGKKFGQWKIIHDRGQHIGGGNYSQTEINMDLGQIFNQPTHVMGNCIISISFIHVQHIGKYQDGKRIDYWEIKDRSGIIMQNYYQLSGGGYYNPDGSKHGQWIDIELLIRLPDIYSTCWQIPMWKIDKWEIKDQSGKTLKQMYYNQDGIMEQSQ